MSEVKTSGFKDLLKVDKETLDQIFEQQAGLVYHYGLQVEELKDQLERSKFSLEVYESELMSAERLKYSRMKNPPTETKIKALIITNPEYIKKKEAIFKLQKSLGIAKLRDKALSVRSEMAVNRGHNAREERRSYGNN